MLFITGSGALQHDHAGRLQFIETALLQRSAEIGLGHDTSKCSQAVDLRPIFLCPGGNEDRAMLQRPGGSGGHNDLRLKGADKTVLLYHLAAGKDSDRSSSVIFSFNVSRKSANFRPSALR